jgi:hypothetical protein
MKPSDRLVHGHQSQRIAESPTVHDLQRKARVQNKVGSQLVEFLYKTTGNRTAHMLRNRGRANGPSKVLHYSPPSCLSSTIHRDKVTTFHRQTLQLARMPDLRDTDPASCLHHKDPAKASPRKSSNVCRIFRSLGIRTLVHMSRVDYTIQALSPDISSLTRDLRQDCPPIQSIPTPLT